jgi:hypothetical protein
MPLHDLTAVPVCTNLVTEASQIESQNTRWTYRACLLGAYLEQDLPIGSAMNRGLCRSLWKECKWYLGLGRDVAIDRYSTHD